MQTYNHKLQSPIVELQVGTNEIVLHAYEGGNPKHDQLFVLDDHEAELVEKGTPLAKVYEVTFARMEVILHENLKKVEADLMASLEYDYNLRHNLIGTI